jgi:uncharacterized spore protein YtfJ
MPVGNTLSKAGPFTAGGGAGFNEFPFEFRVFSEEDVLVLELDADNNETELELDSD